LPHYQNIDDVFILIHRLPKVVTLATKGSLKVIHDQETDLLLSSRLFPREIALFGRDLPYIAIHGLF
jgi:hypothetical protein